MTTVFDALVIGGGHAGIEATRVLSARGHRVGLITMNRQKIGAMSCNPAIGGVAKSHLVYEIDALGGLMGFAADTTGIQSRRLNMRKGPAVRSTRVQCDKDRYAALMSELVSGLSNVEIIEGEAAELIFSEGSADVRGVRMGNEVELAARVVLITAGTFMRGLMFLGDERHSGGRFGDTAAERLSQSFLNSGHVLRRLKTGTPARLRASTINWELCEKQWGDPERRRFSWRESQARLPQLCCYLTYTTEQTHEIIRQNFSKSALFSGQIQGIGPRYCPSVEDKIKRFADRERHQIFLEPEGLDTESIYPNGLSTSLPADVQVEFLRSIPGLEDVELLRPGYAVEYDTLDPTELNSGLMSKRVGGLFFAGQVNRTSGYEEAAAQGLWAGINASLYLYNREPLQPERSRSYLETLVDDLTVIGTEEPYRMFTSRSEYRLVLREDNAAERLFDLGVELGLLSNDQIKAHHQLQLETLEIKKALETQKMRIDQSRVVNLYEYLKRPEVSWEDLSCELTGEQALLHLDLALEKIEIEAKYSGYLSKQEREIAELKAMKDWTLSQNLDLSQLTSLSAEVLEKVTRLKPRNAHELSRISGVTPAAVLSILRLAGRRQKDSVSRETSAP